MQTSSISLSSDWPSVKRCATRDRTDEIVELYVAGIPPKRIALRLSVSPRITRQILIEQGVYCPGRNRAILDRLQKVAATMKPRALRCIRSNPKRFPKPPRPPEEVRAKAALRFRTRYEKDPAFRIKVICRRRMRKMIIDGGCKKAGSTTELMGGTREEVRRHIERQFKRGMTWENNGSGPGEWEIDHIIPCAKFDFRDPMQQRQCFHFSNLRPIWSDHNAAKGDTLERHEQLALV